MTWADKEIEESESIHIELGGGVAHIYSTQLSVHV